MKFPTATALRTPLLVSALLVALITVTGCSKHAVDAGSASDSTTQPGADTGTAPDAKAQAADEAAQAKYNGYVAAYNVLANQDGLASDAKLYFSQTLDKLNADSMVLFSVNLDDPLQTLRDARAVSSDAYPQLDQLADPLIKDLQTLSDTYKQHANYYRTKAYRDDHFALAKQLDPQIRSAFTDALSKLGQLDSALATAEQARDQRNLDTLKGLPNQLPYATANVIMLSKQLVIGTVETAKHGNTPDFAKLDPIKNALTQATQALDQQITQRRTDRDPLGGFRVVLFNARNLLSKYSDLRYAHGANKDFQSQMLLEGMMKDYNYIVEEANRLPKQSSQ